MKPTIDFHGVNSLRLGPISSMTKEQRDTNPILHPGPGFSHRNIRIQDDKGDTQVIGLFADHPSQLELPDEEMAMTQPEQPASNGSALKALLTLKIALEEIGKRRPNGEVVKRCRTALSLAQPEGK